jgi:enterobactin synthetase component D
MKINLTLKDAKISSHPVPPEKDKIQLVESSIPTNLEKASPGRIQEFLAGRIAAYQSAQELGFELNLLPVGSDRGPVWPQDLVGSISHTKKMAVAIVGLSSCYRSLGIDIESIIESQRALDLCSMMASEDEIQFLHNQKDLTFEQGLTLLFSAKEAFYKMLNPLCRCFIEFLEARILFIDLPAQNFEIELISSKAELRPYLGKYQGFFEFTDGFFLTIIPLT